MMKASAVATVADVFQGRTATRTVCCVWTNPHRTTWQTSFATRSTRCGTNSSSCKLAAVLVAINWEWLDKTGKSPITNHYISTRIPLYRNTSTSLLMAVAVVRLYWFRFFSDLRALLYFISYFLSVMMLLNLFWVSTAINSGYWWWWWIFDDDDDDDAVRWMTTRDRSSLKFLIATNLPTVSNVLLSNVSHLCTRIIISLCLNTSQPTFHDWLAMRRHTAGVSGL